MYHNHNIFTNIDIAILTDKASKNEIQTNHVLLKINQLQLVITNSRLSLNRCISQNGHKG